MQGDIVELVVGWVAELAELAVAGLAATEQVAVSERELIELAATELPATEAAAELAATSQAAAELAAAVLVAEGEAGTIWSPSLALMRALDEFFFFALCPLEMGAIGEGWDRILA